jgi:hypothetical protein
MMKEREITGRHVLFGMVGAFGLIITVNVIAGLAGGVDLPGARGEELLRREPDL